MDSDQRIIASDYFPCLCSRFGDGVKPHSLAGPTDYEPFLSFESPLVYASYLQLLIVLQTPRSSDNNFLPRVRLHPSLLLRIFSGCLSFRSFLPFLLGEISRLLQTYQILLILVPIYCQLIYAIYEPY
jgi:hypothetical protein